MSLRMITDPSEFTGLRDEWNALAGPSPFRRWEWMHSWFEAYAATTTLHLLQVCDDDGRMIGLAPWHMQQSLAGGRQLRFLGDGKACGDDVSLLAAPGREEQVVQAVFQWLASAEQSRTWDWIRLEGVTAGDPLVGRLVELFEGQAAPVLRREDLSRWVIDLPPSWDEFVAKFGRNGRHHARSCRRKWEQSENGLRVAAPHSEAEALQLFEVIVELHNRRWKAESHGGCFATAHFFDFLRKVVVQWYAEGALRLRVLYEGDRPLVGGVCTAMGDTISMYLFGRDPDCGRKDAGLILNYFMVEQAIGEGLMKLDYLRGDEPYKARMSALPVAQQCVEIAGRGAFNRVRYLAQSGRDRLKRLIQREPVAAQQAEA